MSPAAASCPACAAPVEFRTGDAAVKRCSFCGSAIARADRGLEDLGKYGAVVETESPLALGLKGVWQGIPFELVGRAQLAHPSGAVWEEWFAWLSDGRWGWLAEAQGRFTWTFPERRIASKDLPALETLEAGAPVAIPGFPPHARWVVAEVSTATLAAADGEIPYRAVPGETYDFADLSGPGGAFATLDYSEDEPLLFAGRVTSLEALGFAPEVVARGREARAIGALKLSCPKCAGALELRAPDATQRVTCPSCGALLDADRGHLRLLRVLERPRRRPFVPVGARGTLDGTTWTVIGYLVRSAKIGGIAYPWEEYLLWERARGFRWLVRSDGHFSLVEQIPVGEVVDSGAVAYHDGRAYRMFQDAPARVDEVAGEFPWKVGVGESVRAVDFVAPPFVLSRETTKGGKDRDAEVTWSHGRYVPVGEVEQAFGVTGLDRPVGIAPNQPYPHDTFFRAAAWAAAGWLALLLAVTTIVRPTPVLTDSVDLTPATGAGSSTVWFSPPMRLSGGKNLVVDLWAGVDNSWVWVEGDFFETATGRVIPFSAGVDYWYGSEGGERWSEGTRKRRVYLSAPAGGEYTLRLETERGGAQPPDRLGVKVVQGVARFTHALAALALLLVVPVGVALHRGAFERRRWEESNVAPEEDDA